MYLAAHPDDENTRFIAYSANELLFNTAYLSLTRGDGGQNLVGPELREQLGLIRTQELLAARRTDGGQQFFTRANDFGYSKTPEETLEIWDREQILGDVVRVIRQFRPDVIVCRFPVDGGGGHGHHTASAVLGLEAFDLAADPAAYPEQLETLEPWQTLRIVVNTGRWWNDKISDDDPGVVTIDVGAYNEVLGTSYTELAARSRTMHKSQGFGSTGERGEKIEYFEHLAGEEAQDDLFEGYSPDWSRVEGSSSVAQKVAVLIDRYDLADPAASIPGLMQVHRELQRLKDDFWREKKIKEVEQLIYDCAGLYLEVTSDDYWASPGDSLSLSFEATARASASVTWTSYSIPQLEMEDKGAGSLDENVAQIEEHKILLPVDIPYSQPYWLVEEGTLGTYRVADEALIGTPENAAALSVDFHINVDGLDMVFSRPVVNKWNDPVTGENYRPLAITPPVLMTFEQPSHIFTGSQEKELIIKVKAIQSGFAGKLFFEEQEGWDVSPSIISLNFTDKGAEQSYTLRVRPRETAVPVDLKATVIADGKDYSQGLSEIVYDHIPAQVYMPAASTKLVYIDIERRGERIAYIPGAGDVIPEALRNIGYQVDELTEPEITAANLKQYDAVITGIRLLNVDERIDFYMPELLKYAEEGGTLVLQYNTRHRVKTEKFSPYPITLSRDRVTEEDAKVTFLMPDHPVLNTPNLITSTDFEGWEQERGLYFPSEWSEDYDAILSWHDIGEDAKDGSLLVAEYGEGHYIYTGISFFRELPAGVPGAYRLLSNLLSLGND
jgi:LmbE family N-acetylglucosaminyl deacetylase